MAAPRVRVEVNREAIRELLRSQQTLALLERSGHAIAAAAGPGHEVQRWVGRNRARVTVRTATHEARAREARDRRLTRAVDAGRF